MNKPIMVLTTVCTFFLFTFAFANNLEHKKENLTAVSKHVINNQLPEKNLKSPVGYWMTVNSHGQAQGIVHIFSELKDPSILNGDLLIPLFKLDNDKKQPPNTLCNRCTGDLKNKALTGLQLVNKAKKTGPSEGSDGEKYTDGTIMDPSNGKLYKLKMWTEENGKKLKVRGYIWLFYKTQTWYRISKDQAENYQRKCGINVNTGVYAYLDKSNNIINKKLWQYCSDASLPKT